MNNAIKLTLLAASTSALLGMLACSTASTEQRPLTPVRTAMVQVVQTGNNIKYSANIVPYTQVDLAFKSGGYVTSLLEVKGADGRIRNVQEGDAIKKGVALAVVRPDDYLDKIQQAKAQLARAQANYDHAKLQFERVTALYNAQSATKPDMDDARAQYESAQAAVSDAEATVSQAQIALLDTTVRSPFDGWVLKRSVDVGALVGPATNAFTVADTHAVKAVFGVPDTAISKIKLGARQGITTDALPNVLNGTVTAISASADSKSRVFSVEVTIPNPQNLLKSGMIASLSIPGQEFARSVTAVPLEAVVRAPDQPQGFAVLIAETSGDTTVVHARQVEVGEPLGNDVALISGVNPGERVVTTGASMVRDGDHVRVIP
jgi:RND family efflux transporter MFP subunit